MNTIKRLSLSFKLVLLFLLTAVAMVFVMQLTTGNAFKKHFQNSLRPHLYQYFQYINNEIGLPPDLKKAQRLSDELKIRIIIGSPEMHWSSDEEFPLQEAIQYQPFPQQYSSYDSGMYKQRHFVIRINKPPYHTIFITQNDSDLPSAWTLIINTILGLLIVLAILYLLLRWMISPLKTLQHSIKRIGSGDLSHRIQINRQDEMGDLSQQINAMAGDIENMLKAKQQLLLAISHELRSPLTRAKVALSLLDEDDLKQGLQDDLNEMELMISELLEAEKLNHRHQSLNLSDVDINHLIQQVIRQYYPNKPIQQHLATNFPILALDEVRLQFVIKNLLGNALQHRKDKQDEISISTLVDFSKPNDKMKIGLQKPQKLTWQIIVEDHGKGIPAEHIAHITEPFYRVDPSRQRKTGGYGLGLYIVKMIIEAHQGRLLIESQESVGTTVKILVATVK